MNADSLLINQVGVTPPKNKKVRPPTRASRLHSFLKQLVQCVLVAALATASYFLISRYILQSVQVAGASMWPTLHDSDQYFLNRWVYDLRAPRRGEIVVLKDPTDGAYCVKRVVALPGEAVYFKNGR